MKPTQTQFAAYQKIFDFFNKRLFDNSLSDCMLGFSRRRNSSHALFTPGQWRLESGSSKAEISLNLKQLREDEPIIVMATLVRQMVHLWQEMYGQPSGNGYYNREWAMKMEEISRISHGHCVRYFRKEKIF
jgi:SprT-like family